MSCTCAYLLRPGPDHRAWFAEVSALAPGSCRITRYLQACHDRKKPAAVPSCTCLKVRQAMQRCPAHVFFFWLRRGPAHRAWFAKVSALAPGSDQILARLPRQKVPSCCAVMCMPESSESQRCPAHVLFLLRFGPDHRAWFPKVSGTRLGFGFCGEAGSDKRRSECPVS